MMIAAPIAVPAKSPPSVGVWLARALVVMLALTIPVLGLEWSLRTFGPFLPGNYTATVYMEPHPVYGFFHAPSSAGWIRTSEYVSHIQINSRGLREREIGLEKPPGTRRLLVIGDSFVEGAQVSVEQTLTRHLESRLGNGQSQPVQVVNAGVGAWGTTQEYLFLNHEGLQYQPDVVVLVFYGGNDVSNNGPRIRGDGRNLRKPYFGVSEDGWLRPLPWRPRRAAEEGWLERLRRDSLLFGVVNTTVMAQMGTNQAPGEDLDENSERTLVRYELPVFAARYTREWEEAWTITEALILAMHKQVEATGAQFLVVHAPTKWEVYAEDWQKLRERHDLREHGWNLDGPNQRLTAFAARTGVPYMDLKPYLLSSAADGPRLYFDYDGHWTARGHEVVAAALSEHPVLRGAQR